MIIKPHFVTDSGCVADQPQRMDFSERHRFIRVLRLVSDTAALRDPASFPAARRNFFNHGCLRIDTDKKTLGS